MDTMQINEQQTKVKKVKMSEDELIYPISINYGKRDWNVVSALREFLSNMLDTKADFSFKHVNGLAVISDNGVGLSKKDFIFGESSKDESSFGQFGEGLKMSLIQLLRENRKAYVRTVGFTVFASKTYSDVYDSEVMLLKFEKNDKKEGTEVYVECSLEELEQAKNLFIPLNENLKKMDQNVFLPSGGIYIVGLYTNSFPNTIFSYDIEDKAITNRDRNIVAGQKLNEHVTSILCKLKNQKAIQEFLSYLEVDSTKYEYQLHITPKHKEVWKKVFDKMYSGKAVISSDFKSDLHAQMMGYKVLRNLPHYMHALLKGIGVETSDVVARNYKGESLFKNDKMVYPISSDYCSNWTVVDAIREMISNAIDTGTSVKVEYSSGSCRIYDSGYGILKKHMIFGISNKSDKNIGQFGEGLKVSSLVLVRNKRSVKIQTKGYNYTPALERFEDYESNLFTVLLEKNQRTKGTVITFDASEREVEDAKSLFTYFKPARSKTCSTNSLDVYADEPTSIYVNGLLTQKINSIFGYNIKDKNVVISRDRNYVNASKLNEYIGRMLSETKNTVIMEKYLKEWIKNPHTQEYSSHFTTPNMDLWIGASKRIFKKACIASYNDKSNFIVKQAGYTVLRNIPIMVEKLLQAAKIPHADQLAKKYEGKGILFENEIIYPITIDYCRSWTVFDAIKELLSNSLDTETQVSLKVDGGNIIISDKGNGIEKKNFLFSSSSKTPDKIGMFGEGLKLAMLVLARNGRHPIIKSSGIIYKGEIRHDREFSSDIMVVKLEKTRKTKGTEITFKGNEQELNTAKVNFIKFNGSKEVSKNMFTPGGFIYVNGVRVTKANVLYSYNLKNKKNLLSRDRKVVDIQLVSKQMESILSEVDNSKIIKNLLTSDFTNYLEEHLSVKLSESVKPAWRKVVKSLYPKHCLSSGLEYDYAAIDKGFEIIGHVSPFQKSILRQLGIKHSHEVAILNGDEDVVKKRAKIKDLSKEGKDKFRKATRVFKKLYGEERSKMIEIVKEFNLNATDVGTLGMYNRSNEKIYVHIDLFESSIYEMHHALGVLIHEQVHHMSGAGDRSREFENALTWELGKIALL